MMMCSVPLHELLTELVAELVLSCSASTMSPGLSSLPLPSLTPPPSNLNHVFHLLVPPYFPAINQLPVPPRHLAAAAPGPPCPLRGPGFILLSNKPLSHCLKSYLASHYLYFHCTCTPKPGIHMRLQHYFPIAKIHIFLIDKRLMGPGGTFNRIILPLSRLRTCQIHFAFPWSFRPLGLIRSVRRQAPLCLLPW